MWLQLRGRDSSAPANLSPEASAAPCSCRAIRDRRKGGIF
jgi:hypothetical protein